MSRIQQILEKAQRDGALHRSRSVADSIAAAVAPIEVPPLIQLPPPPSHTDAAPASPAHRAVQSVILAPWLVDIAVQFGPED